MSGLSNSPAGKIMSLNESSSQRTRHNTAEPQHDLSADELRSKLFHSLHSKGLVNTVKSQLRNKLALELHELATTKMKKKKRKKEQDGSLLQQLSNELVADYLQCCRFDYTLSVFGPESMTNTEKITRYEDILTFLGIQSDHALHQTLIKGCRVKGSKGLLWALLNAVATILKREKSDASCQADDLNLNARDQLEKRMRDVEQTFDSRKRAEDSSQDHSSLEARLIAFQRQAEASKREEIKAEIEKFRAGEARRLELFHKEECRREVETAKRELEDEYSKRFQALSKRERETMDRLYAQEKMLEEEAYKQRQKLLEEMQKHQEREMSTKHSHQLAMKSVELEEQRLGALAEQLRLKEETLGQMDERCESRIRDEVFRTKLQFQEDQQKREEVFRLQEQQLREDKASFESQREALMRLADEAETKREKIDQLEASLHAAKNALASVTRKYEVAMERIREVSDYQRLKERLLVTEKELEQTKQKVAETMSERNTKDKEFQSLLRELMDRKSKTPDNQENMYSKIMKEKENFMTKEVEYQQKLAKMEDKYQEEIRRNKALMRQHEEQMMRQRAMLNEIADLKLAFQKQRQTVEASKLSPRMTNREQPSLFRAVGAVDLSPERVRTHRSPRRKLWEEDEPFENTAQSNLRHQKEVFSKLEQEATELEKAYQDFQERQAYVTRMAQSPVLRPLHSLGSSPRRDNQDYIFSVTRLSTDIPEKDTDADFASIPTRMSHHSPKRPMSTSASIPLTSNSSHPLSSTQAPGASKPVSLGLSTMMLPNDLENEGMKVASSLSSGQLVLTDLENRSHRYGSIETLPPQTLSKVTEYNKDQGGIGLQGFQMQHLADSGVATPNRLADYKDEKGLDFPPSVKLKASAARISQRDPSVSHINQSSPTHTIPTCYSLTQEPIQNLSTTNQSASAASQSYWQQHSRTDFGPRSPREFERLTPLAERSGEADLGADGLEASYSDTRNGGSRWSATAVGVKNSETDLSLRETALIVLDSSTKDGNITYPPNSFERAQVTEPLRPFKGESASFGRRESKSEELEPRSLTPNDVTNDDIEQPVLSLDQAWKTQQKPPVPIIPLPNEPHRENKKEKERPISIDAAIKAQQSEMLSKSSSVVSPIVSQRNSDQEDRDGSNGKNEGAVDLLADVNPLMKQYMEMVLKQREGGAKEVVTKKIEDGNSEKSASERSGPSIKSKASHSNREPQSTHEGTDDEFDWG